jgi:hypothetical protein
MFHDETGFLIGDAQDLFVRKNASDFWARANRTGGRADERTHLWANTMLLHPNIMCDHCFLFFFFSIAYFFAFRLH